MYRSSFYFNQNSVHFICERRDKYTRVCVTLCSMDEKRRKATRVVGRGEKRGAITGERHSYRIWAQISLIITACTATYVLHRLSRTRSCLPVPTLKDTSPCGVPPVVCHWWRWWTTTTVISAVTPHWLAITRAKWSGQYVRLQHGGKLSEIKRNQYARILAHSWIRQRNLFDSKFLLKKIRFLDEDKFFLCNNDLVRDKGSLLEYKIVLGWMSG